MKKHKMHQNSADLTTEKAIRALRQGDYTEFEQCLSELDRLSHYAALSPSWHGMHNLTHIMRAFVTQIFLDHLHREKPKLNVIAIGERIENELAQ